MKRPTFEDCRAIVATPRGATMMQLLGSGARHNANALSHDEFKAVNKLYGFKEEGANQKFLQAGADRNAIREAECDGLRLLAWIARYVPVGEDPLKHLVQAAVEAGWDVDPADVEWMEEP